MGKGKKAQKCEGTGGSSGKGAVAKRAESGTAEGQAAVVKGKQIAGLAKKEPACSALAARTCISRLSRADLEDLVFGNISSLENKQITLDAVMALLPSQIKGKVKAQGPVGDEKMTADIGLFSVVPSVIVMDILMRLSLVDRLTCCLAVSKGFRIFRLEPSVFHSLDVCGTRFSSAGLSKLISMLPGQGKETRVMTVYNSHITPKDWAKLLQACAQNTRMLKVNGKSLARAVLTSLQQVNCTELVTLSLNELKNTDYLVDSNIAKILCTTPKLRALRLQYSAGDVTLSTWADSLRQARHGGVPLLEHLHLCSEYEWEAAGMDWQAFATLAQHFPELKSVDTSLDAQYTTPSHSAINLSQSGRALRGTSILPTHATLKNDTFKAFARLERLRIRSIGQWQWKSGDSSNHLILSSQNFQWFALRCFNCIAATIKQLEINTGYLDHKKGQEHELPPLPALGGVLKRCCALPHLECLSLLNMLVEADDFAPPFSAPNLRHICLRNCGEASLEAASNFITNPDELLDVAAGGRTARARLCYCSPMCDKCQHKRFEHPKGDTLWVSSHLTPSGITSQALASPLSHVICPLYQLAFDDPDSVL